MACYKCGVTITNVPISAEHVKAMAADATTHLLQSLGLRIRQPTVDDDPRRYRGVKISVIYDKSWEQRCKGWLHGTNKKKGPGGEFLYIEMQKIQLQRAGTQMTDLRHHAWKSPLKSSASSSQGRWLWKLMIWQDTKSR